MKVETLEQYYVEELRDLYDAEKQLLKALPKMAKAATHEELKSAFEEHAEQTQEQVNRLERILQKHGKNGRGKRCRAMLGLIEEGRELLEMKPLPEIADVGLITNAQKVEHYEIAGYGCTTAYAKLLGRKDEAELLHRTLVEEKETDSKLSKLAKSVVNREAAKGTEEESRTGARSKTSQSRRGSPRASAQATAQASKPSRSSGSRRKSGGSRQSGSADSEAQPTKDLDEIKSWVEARGGTPARVRGTGSGKDPGLLRIDFPGYSGEQSLEHISWDEWYEKFQENNLTFLHQDKTKNGQQSRFFKLVCMEEGKN